MRVKPLIDGLKQSSFIKGSKAVCDIFKFNTLVPFIPKSDKVYGVKFRTGPDSDDSFMPFLEFSVEHPS